MLICAASRQYGTNSRPLIEGGPGLGIGYCGGIKGEASVDVLVWALSPLALFAS